MNNNRLNKLTPPTDDYISFMVYLRENGVWKVVSNVFRMLNEVKPKDPIEYFRTNMKADNSDNRAIKQMLRETAKAEKILTILKRDKLMLTAKLNTLRDRILKNRKNSSFVCNTEETETVANESSFYDFDHV